MSDECGEILDTVYAYIDGELSAADCARIREHLAECAPCLEKFGLEQAVKDLVARSCGCDIAPPELRARLLIKLHEARVEYTRTEYRTDFRTD